MSQNQLVSSVIYVKKPVAVALLLMSLVLFAVQGAIWARSTAHTRSETDKQNVESRRPPSEVSGIAGVCLLIAAGVLASVPRRRTQNWHT